MTRCTSCLRPLPPDHTRRACPSCIERSMVELQLLFAGKLVEDARRLADEAWADASVVGFELAVAVAATVAQNDAEALVALIAREAVA